MAELLNIVNKEGKVITFFDGRITLAQLITIALFVAGIVICLRIFSGVMKIVIVCVLVLVMGINVGLLSPEQLHDVASVMQSSRSTEIEKYDKQSKNIKVKDNKAYVKLEGSWIDVDAITSFSKGRKGSMTVNVGNESYVIKDKTVIKFIKEFAK